MYDTVVASVDVAEPIDEKLFTGGRETGDVMTGSRSVRLWYNAGDEYLPRVSYWRGANKFEGGRLRVEFSIPKMANIDALGNPSEADKEKALGFVTAFVQSCFAASLPDVRTWRVGRVDYAWNWVVGDKLAEYMSLVQSLHMGGLVRHPYPETDGVVWKTKRRNARWIKFYSKSRLEGVTDKPAVLRYEVSNYRRVLPYMCGTWFRCERTVAELLRPGRALYVLAHAWDRLGLGAGGTYGATDATLMLRLRGSFGRGAPGAYYALSAIRKYGAETWRVYGLMSENTYYVWKRKLTERGYLSEVDVVVDEALDVLHLPVREVVEVLLDVKKAQNLDASQRPLAKEGLKISQEFSSPVELWQKVADFLGVPGGSLVKYLVREWDFGAFDGQKTA